MVVYRIVAGKRQYLRRMVHHMPLWCDDPNDAARLDAREATRLATWLHSRSVGTRQHPATQAPGEYEVQETP